MTTANHPVTPAMTPVSLPSYSLKNPPGYVSLPNYSLTTLPPGIVHIGPGGFFLAHFASYMHDYMQMTKDTSWGITVASLRSPGTITGLRKQDHRYVLVEREEDKQSAKVMGAIASSIFAPDDPTALVAAIARAETKIVSMTITNHGYYLTAGDGSLDLSHHDVVSDLDLEYCETQGEHKKVPRTAYWYLTNGLLKRMASNQPLTVVSLDNVAQNSASLKKGLVEYINASGQSEFDAPGAREALLAWIDLRVDFPTTLVDRITPEVTAAFRQSAAAYLGFECDVVVGTEVFRQLVIEKGRFPVPDWEKVGVEVVPDCKPYWQLKFLGLNAAHQVPAIVGQRLGFTYVHEAMANPGIAGLTELFHKELAVILGAERVASYGPKIRRRFADSAPMDTLRRVGARGTSKASERLLFAVEETRKLSDKLAKAPTFVVACWLLNLGCTDEFGNTFTQDDKELAKLQIVHQSVVSWTRSESPQAHELAHILRKIGEEVRDNRFIRLAGVDAFVQELSWALLTLTREGTNKAIAALLAR